MTASISQQHDATRLERRWRRRVYPRDPLPRHPLDHLPRRRPAAERPIAKAVPLVEVGYAFPDLVRHSCHIFESESVLPEDD
jgi:hypothetical protein